MADRFVEIRRLHPDVRVLFLTARDNVEDKVKGWS